VGAFCGRIEDCGVLGWFYLDDLVFLGYQREFGHAVGAGEVGLSWDDAVVRNHGWLIECFLAALVGASEFFRMLVHMEKLHASCLPYQLNIEYIDI
jgi:hypothetical protein